MAISDDARGEGLRRWAATRVQPRDLPTAQHRRAAFNRLKASALSRCAPKAEFDYNGTVDVASIKMRLRRQVV